MDPCGIVQPVPCRPGVQPIRNAGRPWGLFWLRSAQPTQRDGPRWLASHRPRTSLQHVQQQQQGRTEKKESSSSHLDMVNPGFSWYFCQRVKGVCHSQGLPRASHHEMTTPLCGLSPQHPGIVRTTEVPKVLYPQSHSKEADLYSRDARLIFTGLLW